MLRRFILMAAGALLCLGGRSLAGPPAVDFNRDIRPILSNNCFACHGPDEKARKAELRLDTEEGARSAIVLGKPEASGLIERITSTKPDERMPPAKTGKTLSAAEIDLLKRWITEGASYQKHWAYVVPRRPALPAVRHGPDHPVDRFILATLESRGLALLLEADRYTLARRVALDLTGLPPSLQEADAFVADRSPGAYERYVDRLLAKPAYGEHAARLWLDLARYADSAGYADDPARTIWAYRDYVIRSFNQNKPFDQFTIEQLAGDLLPNATDEQLIATAFHRNTMTNSEGGTNDEEFRSVAVVDRVNTTMQVWMGTSIACAQCHTHKYDPITQTEYFQLYAFFNNTADADRNDESPLHTIMTPAERKERAEWQAEITAIEKSLGSRGAVIIDGQSEWEAALIPDKSIPAAVVKALAIAADERTVAQTTAVADYYIRNVTPAYQAERERLVSLNKLLTAKKPVTVPIMQELAGSKRRKTRIQIRGNFLDLADEVNEGTPSVLHPLPAGSSRDRLALARWLVAPENPLTARVVANRYWEQFFGHGLIRSSEEFGTQGELPSHPELLDWLATELVRLQWDTRAFVKMIVMSATYRQSSKVTPEMLERDADNRLLSRGPRQRLTAEMVRDATLFAGGLLSEKMYGPSVNPPQPALGVNAAFGGAIDWKTSEGADRHRRGLYTTWRRSNLYPSMGTFDAPNRDVCTVRRNHSNTPLQALVTLNDTVSIEAAQALARMTIKDGGANNDERARFAFRRCLTRPVTDNEMKRLVALVETSKSAFAKEPAKAKQMATEPIGPVPAGMDVVDLAAWTVVANVLMNLDEALMKR